MNNVTERILMCGNEAMAEAAILAGCDAYFGYPITPQNEISAYMADRMPEEGRVFIQSESELAAINMVFGAAATGKRAMTSSSSPGISLMQEGMSYLAGAELPAVVVNVMRGGPGLGNIAPAQGDYFQATRGGGHGDYKTIVLGPSSVQEMADCMFLAFDLADQYRMTAMILADGVLGQMMEPLTLEPKLRRELPPKDWALTGPQRPRAEHRPFPVARRRVPWKGTTRSSKPSTARSRRKRSAASSTASRMRRSSSSPTESSARIARAAVNKAREDGIPIGLIRPITLWPFPSQQISQAAEEFRALLDDGNELRPDARGREAGGGRQGARALLRAHGRRHADRGRGPGKDSRVDGLSTEMTTKTDIQANAGPEGLPDALLPGLRPRHRPPAAGGGDRRTGHPGPHDRHRPGRLCGARVQLSRRGHDRGRPRAGPRRRDRHETLQPRQDHLLLPGRRRPGGDRHGGDHPRRPPGGAAHGHFHQQRRLRHDGRPDGPDDRPRASHDHHAPGPPSPMAKAIRSRSPNCWPCCRGRSTWNDAP